jgi:hypothetical protein
MTTETERAKQLAEDHWKYISATLKVHGVGEEETEIIGHHYTTAMIHGFIHGVEAERTGLFRPQIGPDYIAEEVEAAIQQALSGQEAERISGEMANTPPICASCARGYAECDNAGETVKWCGWYDSALREQIAEAKEPQALDLIQHLHRQRAFSLKTFGPGARTKGVIDHIRKELAEIEADPHDLYEWVDLILLSLDGAWRAGHDPEDIAKAIDTKQTRNEARKWPDWRTADPDKAIEHDRTGE